MGLEDAGAAQTQTSERGRRMRRPELPRASLVHCSSRSYVEHERVLTKMLISVRVMTKTWPSALTSRCDGEAASAVNGTDTRRKTTMRLSDSLELLRRVLFERGASCSRPTQRKEGRPCPEASRG